MPYLRALEDALANGQPVSDRAICAALKMSRQMAYEWQQDPAFRRWMAEQLADVNNDQ
jgi:hypothetical protein